MNEVTDPRGFADARRALGEASMLPSSCYTSAEWYALEVERIFMRHWLLVGRADQIAVAGDYMTMEVAGQSVLAVRGADERVRAFSPACRHRGTIIASGKGHTRAFVCPYHGWTYSLDGALIGAPETATTPGFDRSHYGLVPIRLESWEGFLFVNFDAGAKSLSEHLADLPRVMARYRMAELVWTRERCYSLACNWKTYVDNSVEAYHVPSVHGRSLEPVGPMVSWTAEPHES